MENNSDTAFLITAFDQLREVEFTVHMLRTLWASTRKSPIVIVVTGDRERKLSFDDDPWTRVVHLDDMVGDDFRTLVSTSIARQIQHGMLEIKDFQRLTRIKTLVHMHGDILLLGEKGFFKELEDWRKTGKPIAADNVGAQNPVVKNIKGREWCWKFYGVELMPQLFVADMAFCNHSGFMHNMFVYGDLEQKATEYMLLGNLHRATWEAGNGHALYPRINPLKDKESPYRFTFEKYVHVVKANRTQWGLHKHWGGFCHFGNSLHYTKEQREARNTQVLERYGIDLSKW